MALDSHEQEQIDSLKVFWQHWGKWISVVVATGLVGFLGYKGFQYYEAQQSEKAAVVFDRVTSLVDSQNLPQLKSAAQLLQADYPSTVYAARSALVVSKVAFEKNDLALAQSQLEWLLQNSKDSTVLAVAHLRLASILLDQKRYDAAVSELTQEHPTTFDALFLDQRGDVAVAKGDIPAARDAYKAALAKLVGEAPIRQFIQTKLDALGG